MKWLLTRLSEPSTWGGLGLIVSQIASYLYSGATATGGGGWGAVATTILGVVATVVPEGNNAPTATVTTSTTKTGT